MYNYKQRVIISINLNATANVKRCMLSSELKSTNARVVSYSVSEGWCGIFSPTSPTHRWIVGDVSEVLLYTPAYPIWNSNL